MRKRKWLYVFSFTFTSKESVWFWSSIGYCYKMNYVHGVQKVKEAHTNCCPCLSMSVHVSSPGLSEECKVQTPAFTDAVRLYRQTHSQYGTWDMMCGAPPQVRRPTGSAAVMNDPITHHLSTNDPITHHLSTNDPITHHLSTKGRQSPNQQPLNGLFQKNMSLFDLVDLHFCQQNYLLSRSNASRIIPGLRVVVRGKGDGQTMIRVSRWLSGRYLIEAFD